MKQDILFKDDSFVFSYRVGGILIQNDHLLLQKPKKDDFGDHRRTCALPGNQRGDIET